MPPSGGLEDPLGFPLPSSPGLGFAPTGLKKMLLTASDDWSTREIPPLIKYHKFAREATYWDECYEPG